METPPREPFHLHVRKRPGMYIGGLNPWALRSMITSIIAEQLALPDVHPERVRCMLSSDGFCTIELHGPCRPLEPRDVDPVKNDGFYDPARPFELIIACSMSDRLDADVTRDGRRFTQSFAAGVALAPPHVRPSTAPPSVRITYRPDPALFSPTMRPSFLGLCAGFQELAAFHPATRFTIESDDGQRRDYHYPAGLRSLLEELEPSGINCNPVWSCEAADGTSRAAAVIVEASSETGIVHSFVNAVRTRGHGTHVHALRRALAHLRSSDILDDDPARPLHPARNPLAGLTVILAIWLDDPTYANSTKDKLGDPRAGELVEQMIASQLPAEVTRTRDQRA